MKFMGKKQYFTVSAIIFTIIGVAHLARIMFELEAVVAGYDVPLWVSGVVVVVTGYLATRGFFAAYRHKEPLFGVKV